MEQRQNLLYVFGFAAAVVLFIFAGMFFLPWEQVHWGKLALQPAETVTVSGKAEKQQQNQIARFTAGVSSVNDNKDTAVSEVNKKMESLISALTTFGIAKDDIKTENLNVYQNEESYYDNGTQKYRPGQWRVSNSVSIKLRTIDRASELVQLLTQSGANNIYGPNFSVDDTNDSENALLKDALDDARKKAEIIAQAGGKKLGKMVQVDESGQTGTFPLYASGMGGGGAPIEPGTQTISKTLTVTFELQ